MKNEKMMAYIGGYKTHLRPDREEDEHGSVSVELVVYPTKEQLDLLRMGAKYITIEEREVKGYLDDSTGGTKEEIE